MKISSSMGIVIIMLITLTALILFYKFGICGEQLGIKIILT